MSIRSCFCCLQRRVLIWAPRDVPTMRYEPHAMQVRPPTDPAKCLRFLRDVKVVPVPAPLPCRYIIPHAPKMVWQGGAGGQPPPATAADGSTLDCNTLAGKRAVFVAISAATS
jgi:hypothetical protein